MALYRFLGDIHGDFACARDACIDEAVDHVIQVGDFGLGFGREPAFDSFPSKLRFIRGNHDNIAVCRSYPGWIPDGEVEDIVGDKKMMFIGGAWSIDRQHRTPGRDWWDDEELNDYEWEDMQKIYHSVKPTVMVTHDIPYLVREQTIQNQFNGIGYSRTSYWLQKMFDEHKPKLWFHGHHHIAYQQTIEECLFVGLGINRHVTVEL